MKTLFLIVVAVLFIWAIISMYKEDKRKIAAKKEVELEIERLRKKGFEIPSLPAEEELAKTISSCIKKGFKSIPKRAAWLGEIKAPKEGFEHCLTDKGKAVLIKEIILNWGK